jgi:hypothetical protein
MPSQKDDGAVGTKSVNHLVAILAGNVVVPVLVGPGCVRQPMDSL